MNRFRKSRFGDDAASRVSYTPTVSRALISEEEPELTEERLTPSDFVPAGRESWDELEHLPMPADSELPLPLVTQVDGDEPAANGPVLLRVPRDSLDLGAPESFAPLPLPESMPPDSLALEPDSEPETGEERVAVVASEHALWTEARALLASGQHEATADVLERLCIEVPNHEPARSALLRICVMLKRVERVGLHTAWLMRGHLQSDRAADACATYQHVRAELPDAPLPEIVLVVALTAADATGQGPIVLDATNLLLKYYGTSVQAPKALLIAAKHQLMSSANEAAIQTLRYLVASYPLDPAAEPARRKLAELGQS